MRLKRIKEFISAGLVMLGLIGSITAQASVYNTESEKNNNRFNADLFSVNFDPAKGAVSPSSLKTNDGAKPVTFPTPDKKSL